MDNNELLMIVLAFVVGYMCSGMMKQMCGGRLVEGSLPNWINDMCNTGDGIEQAIYRGIGICSDPKDSGRMVRLYNLLKKNELSKRIMRL